MPRNPLRDLPSVDAVLRSPELRAVEAEFPHAVRVRAVRRVLAAIRAGDGAAADDVAGRVVAELRRDAEPGYRHVINATGIVLHTNLGRSVLAEPAVLAARTAASGYLDLELDLESGKRSSRQAPLRGLLRELTGAESATVVNNCAAATVIALRAVAREREVVVSRGQLVEIGGGFRVPEIMAVSGAVLREVGTTNITRIADYESAITDRTAALMLVHQSNFRIRGFVKSVELDELVALGRRRGVPVIDDCGSGAMIDFGRLGLPGEPVIPERIRAGADLVLFSGDKLLGGPQSGLILGRADLIELIESDPLMRAFRLDKVTLAALEATLRLYLDEATALREVPTLRMIAVSGAEARARAESLAGRLAGVPDLTVEVRDAVTYVGGGSVPDQELPTVVVAVRSAGRGEGEMARRLRRGEPAVMARLADGWVLLDPRTLLPGEDEVLARAVAACA